MALCETVAAWEKYWGRKARGEQPPEPGEWIFYLEIEGIGVNPSKRLKERNIVARFEPVPQYHVRHEEYTLDPMDTFDILQYNKRNRPVKFARGTLADEQAAYQKMSKVGIVLSKWMLI